MLKLNLFNSLAFITKFKVLHNLSPDLSEAFPWFLPNTCWDRLQHPATLNRISGHRECMDGCFSTVHENDLSLPQVGGQRWVELFLHSKEIYWYNSKDTWDWLTDLPLSSAFDSYWSLCLNPVCSCPELPMLASSLLCSRLGWDWNHHRPVKPHIRLEAVWCFWQKKWYSPKEYFAVFTPAWFGSSSDCLETMCKQMTLRGNHQSWWPWRNDVLNQRRDNQQCCSLDRVVWEQAGSSLFECEGSIFSSQCVCYCEILYFWLSFK